MKLAIKIFIYLSFCLSHSYASKVDKIAQEIAYASQNIASDYLYLYKDEKSELYKTKLKNSVELLEKNFRELAKEADKETKNILDFLSYSKDQIKDTLSKDVSKERVSEILDYSGTLLEGVESVLKSSDYNLSVSQQNRLRLLKSKKFYMSYKLGFDIENSKNRLQKELDLLEEVLQSDLSFKSYKTLLDKDEVFFPNMISLLSKDIWEKI